MSNRENSGWAGTRAGRQAVALACVWIALSGTAARSQSESAAEVLARAQAVYLEVGPRPALEIFQQALGLYRSAGDAAGEAVTLGLIGNCHKRFGDYPKALEFLDAALAMKRRLGDRLEEGKTLSHLGLVYWEMARYPQAIERFESAIEAAREAGDPRLEGSALNNLSLVRDELGEYQASVAGYQRALELYGRIDFPRGESDTLANIGGVHLLLGRYRQAMDYYRRALAIDRELGFEPAVSSGLGNLALCHLGLGEVEPALESFDQALDLARRAGLRQEEGYWLAGKGNALLHLGKYDLALDLHRQSLRLREETGSRGELVEALAELGELLLRLGDLAGAETHFRRALQLAEEIGQDRGVTLDLLRLGDLEWHRRRWPQAAELYGRALKRARAAGDQARTGEALVQLAATDRQRGRLAEGLERGREALAAARRAGMRLLEARALRVLGDLDRSGGALELALDHYAAGEAIAAAAGEPDLLWRLEYGKGLALAAGGRKSEAVAALRQAVELIEGVRARLREERFRAGYLEDKTQVYVELARLLLELGRLDEAFSWSEQLRARTFLALLDRTPAPRLADRDRGRRAHELRSRIRQLQRVLEAEQVRPGTERRPAAVRTFSAELAAAESAYQELLDDLRAADFGPRAGAPVPDRRRLQRLLGPGRAVVEYVVSQTSVMVFVLTAEALRATAIEVPRADLETRVELLRDLLERTGSDAWRKPALGLREILIRPIERRGWLDGIRELYLVPHRILHYLPFALLPRPGAGADRLLIEDYVLANLPSSAVLAHGAAPAAAAGSFLALAPECERLPFAQEEARRIGRMFADGRRVLTGDLATEGAFKRLAPGFKALHLATHAEFNKQNPLLSSLELEAGHGEDGRLQVHEILELGLDADLVTLSACETALASGHFAEVPAGDELVGLTRAFLIAGSAAVLSSLWRVDDHSTLELMVAFYDHLGTENKARALALAQRRLIGGAGRYRHPYYWAPFVLHGAMAESSGKAPDAAVKGK